MAYENKKKQLFECLDAAEKNIKGSCLEQRNPDYSKRRNEFERDDERDRSTERYKKKDSIFKQPELPINKCLRARKRPDHEKNPHRYKHYTLADVTDTSDRMNSSAAFSFLREMEDRKSRGDNEESTSDTKIVFKNSTKLRPKRDADEDDDKKDQKIIGNKFVMKEYVVGEKRQKVDKKTPKPSSSSSAKQLKLSHLDDDEEEDD